MALQSALTEATAALAAAHRELRASGPAATQEEMARVAELPMQDIPAFADKLEASKQHIQMSDSIKEAPACKAYDDFAEAATAPVMDFVARRYHRVVHSVIDGIKAELCVKIPAVAKRGAEGETNQAAAAKQARVRPE